MKRCNMRGKKFLSLKLAGNLEIGVVKLRWLRVRLVVLETRVLEGEVENQLYDERTKKHTKGHGGGREGETENGTWD